MKGLVVVLLLSVGIVPLFFPHEAASLPFNNEIDTPILPTRRQSKDRLMTPFSGGVGGLFSQYGIGIPGKADFDLARILDGSHELGDPFILSNDILLDPTLRSRRRRRQVVFPQPVQVLTRQAPPLQFGVSSAGVQTGSALCIPYMNTNPICRHASFGLTSPLHQQNALLSYYYQPQQMQQQQAQPSAPLPVFGVYQSPTPDQPQMQGETYDQIHTTFPNPYQPAPAPLAVETTAPPEIAETTMVTTTDNPAPLSDGTWGSSPVEQDDEAEKKLADPAHPGNYPDSSFYPPLPPSSSPRSPPSTSQRPVTTTTTTPPPPPPTYPPPPKQVTEEHLNMLKKLHQQEDDIRSLREQLEQAAVQIAAYEQENAVYKDQYLRAEEANTKLRERVVQLENTNQHLQEQNGHHQQEITEQRHQINGLKIAQKQSQDKLQETVNQMTPLNKQIDMQRKELEDFILRIRKLDEENDNLKKQVKLYQLKINYVLGRQKEQQNDEPVELNDQPVQTSTSGSTPEATTKPQYTDDELDPELIRMDAELAALNKKNGSVPKKEASVMPVENKARDPNASKSIPQWETPGGF